MKVIARARRALGVASLCLGLVLPTAVSARPAPSEILIEAGSGKVLHAYGADELRRPASIAKVMTLFLVFDALDSGKLHLHQALKISDAAASQEPSRLGLWSGRTIPVETAMRAVAIKSANDAAVVLAEALARNEQQFARLMTRKARALGMVDTEFGNATGLPDRKTRTTARDIAVLARAIIMSHPDRYPLFGRRTLVWNEQSIANHNHLLGRVTGVDGIKTGYTAQAGFTLAASAKRNGRRLIAVVLGEPSRKTRDDRVGTLLESGFATRILGEMSKSRSAGKLVYLPGRKVDPAEHVGAVFHRAISKG